MRVNGIEFVSKKFPELNILEKDYTEFREFESGLRSTGIQSWPVVRDSWKGDPGVTGKIAVIKRVRSVAFTGLFESKLLVDWWEGSWDGNATGNDNNRITINSLMELFGYEALDLVKRTGRMLRPVKEE